MMKYAQVVCKIMCKKELLVYIHRHKEAQGQNASGRKLPKKR